MMKKGIIASLVLGSLVYGATDHRILDELVNTSIKTISVQQELQAELNRMDKSLKLKSFTINKTQKAHELKLQEMEKELAKKPTQEDIKRLETKDNELSKSILSLKSEKDSDVKTLTEKYETLNKEFVEAGYFKEKSNAETLNKIDLIKKENESLKIEVASLNKRLDELKSQMNEKDKTIIEINNKLTTLVEKLLLK